ncbi:MAG: hypothetical protein MRY20_00345 [Pelagibacteraceae bacterium]|jgi:hypothetical protein|nr:hypothetical protein [Pelagibacteraceae bacterium]
MLIFSDEIKLIIRKLSKEQLINLIDHFAYTTELVQDANNQHLIDKQKLIVFLENEQEKLERTLNWQKNKLRENFREIEQLKEHLRIATEKEQTKH